MAAPTDKRTFPQSMSYGSDFPAKVSSSKLFVIGAGGIGCELLKTLALVGFQDIHLIDLDTIDVSNLNRQFLFRKEHVGKSKSQVARESVLRYKKNIHIKAYHDSIFNSDYGVDFFKQFNVVLNALDNRAARNHVNRMCLAARVPLVEAGTAGYLGQVQVIQRGLTECYECQPKPAQKSFPGCTIRNTPSEPIHCIVWAKHLFNQLFGEEDPDQDVSPDTEDPELTADAGKSALDSEAASNVVGGIQRKSTRGWAEETGYNPQKIFNKLFRDDILYLLSMENLWKTRTPPDPLDYDAVYNKDVQDTEGATNGDSGISDQKVWSLDQCRQVFATALNDLSIVKDKTEDKTLVWDKDDIAAMDFVACAANLRMQVFHIPRKSRFDIKSMAGNIIPAIATTNAVIAAVQVMECLRIICGNVSKSKATYLGKKPNPHKMLLNPCMLVEPNPKCYVCSDKPEVVLQVNPATLTLWTLSEKVLKAELGMQSPDIELDDGKGTILLTCEEGVTEGNESKYLSEFNIIEGTRLKCDDFLQEYNLIMIINVVESLEDGEPYKLIVDRSLLNAQPEKSTGKTNGSSKQGDKSKDDMEVIDRSNSSDLDMSGAKKRPASDGDGQHETLAKRARQDSGEEQSEPALLDS